MTIFFEMLDISRDNYLMFEDLILRLKQLGRFDDVQDEKRLDFLRKKEHFHSNFLKELENSKNLRLKILYLRYLEFERKEDKKERYFDKCSDDLLNYLISALEKKLSDFSLKQIEIEKKIMGSEEK